MELEFASSTRRRSSSLLGSRRCSEHGRRYSDEAQLDQARASALAPHAAPSAAPPVLSASSMFAPMPKTFQDIQRWEGNNLVARVVPAVQPVQQSSGFGALSNSSDASQAAIGGGMPQAPPLDQSFGQEKKMSTDCMAKPVAQPVAKRWQIEAYAGSDRDAARVGGVSTGDGQVQPVRAKISLKVKMPVNRAVQERHQCAPGLI